MLPGFAAQLGFQAHGIVQVVFAEGSGTVRSPRRALGVHSGAQASRPSQSFSFQS